MQWVQETRVQNQQHRQCHVFDLQTREKRLVSVRMKIYAIVHGFKPLIPASGFGHCLLQTPPSGFLASQITTSQWTKSCNKITWLFRQLLVGTFNSCGGYLANQVIFLISKGKHLHLEALEVRGIANPLISPDWVEDHLVWVHWVWTA